MSGVLHRRDLDRTMNWLCQVLGIGPGLGDVFFVAASGSAYEAWLKKIGVYNDHLFTTIAAGYAALTADRNDILCVSPEAHVQTAEIDWAKSQSHLVGLGGPMRVSDYYCAGVMIYTATASVANLLHVTGNNCQFHNIGVYNNGANAANVSALKVGATTTGYNNKFFNSHFCGLMNSTQLAVETAASIRIASGSSDYYFKNCVIGHNCWGARTTAKQGQVYYGGTTESGAGAGYGPQNGTWEDCLFLSQGTTTTCVMVRVEEGGNEAMDRTHFFKKCTFDNWPGSAATITQVFDDDCLTWHHVRLIDCSAHGYSEWQDRDNTFYTSNMGTPQAADAGIGVEPTS